MPSVINQTDGSTVYDLCMKAYGSLNYLFKFIKDNPIITSLDYDLKTAPGQQFVYDPLFVINTPPDIKPRPPIVNNIRSISAHSGQTIYDLCLMTYGNLGNIFKLIKENNIDNLNKVDLTGKVLTYDINFIQDRLYWKNLNNNNIVINTGGGNGSILTIGRAFSNGFSLAFS